MALPWLIAQREEHMLLASWPVEASSLRERVPRAFGLEMYEGRTYLGMIPFRMAGLRMRFLPPIPGTSDFPEVDLFTFVTYRGAPGLYFLRLDAASRLSSWIGSRVFHLPYAHADIQMAQEQGWTRFRSRAGSAELDVRYRGVGPVFHAESGSLEYFLLERYGMFGRTRSGRVFQGREERPLRALQRAEVTLLKSTLPRSVGLPQPAEEPLLYYCARSSIHTWPPVPVKS